VNNNLGFALCSLGRLAEGLEVEAEAARAFKEIRNPRLEAASRTYSARFLAKAGRLVEAEAEARAAVALSSTTPPAQAQAQAMLSQILLAEGRAPEALAAAEEAVRLLEVLGGIDEGESLVRLSLAEALEANGQAEAAARAAKEAHDRLMARAAPIADPEVRRSFLELVADNARTVALARRGTG
jgi:tetratricopeptide (TPR) repeat protein